MKLPKTTVGLGRSSYTFEYFRVRSERCKIAELRSTTNKDQLVFVAQVQLKAKGKIEASKILKETTNSLTLAKKNANKDTQDLCKKRYHKCHLCQD